MRRLLLPHVSVDSPQGREGLQSNSAFTPDRTSAAVACWKSYREGTNVRVTGAKRVFAATAGPKLRFGVAPAWWAAAVCFLLGMSIVAHAVVAGESPVPRIERGGFRPYPMDWKAEGKILVDHRRFLEGPAGKDGFIRVEKDRLVRPDGRRFRIWGVNICGPDCYPEKEVAGAIADDLARLGVNSVRFHHMDSTWGSLFDPKRNDTRALDPERLDRLDYFIDQLAQRGIYANLNLNVGRNYKEGDGVRDWQYLGYGKSATYFNPRLIELQHEYARQLLTHRNPYREREYRHDPAVVFIEIVNENSVLEGWVGGRLVGDDKPKPSTWSPLPTSYAEELTDLYNRWLAEKLPPEQLAAVRREAGVGEEGRVPRLAPNQFKSASRERFAAEARFYMEVEQRFFEGMKRLLRDELQCQPLIIGTSDHNDSFAGFAHIKANMMFDVIDSHGYWEHPRLDGQTWIRNTPMVNDPLDSTVAQFARSPVAGKPFTISEVNHPFPHEFACEGFPILTAYALLHDWDGIYWFTWGRGRNQSPDEGIRRNGWFDFSNDPMKVVTIALCAAAWHRHDVRPAEKTLVRSYSPDELIDTLRMERWKERPYFKPGFPRSASLRHALRFEFAEADRREAFPPEAKLAEIASDTGEIHWRDADKKRGWVSVDTPQTQALIGFVGRSERRTTNLAIQLDNVFAAVTLTADDDRPIAQSRRLLLGTTAWSGNSGMKWADDRQLLLDHGAGPVLIERVTGEAILSGLAGAKAVRVTPLSPTSRAAKPAIVVQPQQEGNRIVIRLSLGEPATCWYLIEVER